MSLTDFNGAEGDSLILGDLAIKTGAFSTALLNVNFFQSVSVFTSFTGSAASAAPITITPPYHVEGAQLSTSDTIGAVAFSGTDFTADVSSIFAVNFNGVSNAGFLTSRCAL